jgi:RNA polymerase sigma-70 factor (ECF subfamily)
MDMTDLNTDETGLKNKTPQNIEVNNTFYYKYEPKIRVIVSGILIHANQPNDIDDCINTVFLKIMEKLRQYDETRGSMEAFVAVIARSAALNYCKSNIRKSKELIGDENLDYLSSPIEYQNEAETKLLVENIIAKLNGQEKLLFTMRFLYYETPEEIAKILQIKRNTADKRISRLKNKIKKFFARGGINI